MLGSVFVVVAVKLLGAVPAATSALILHNPLYNIPDSASEGGQVEVSYR